MTSFVDDNGNYLDYSGEDFGITKQAATWFDFKIKGDVSVDFKIPFTAKNKKALGYYDIQQLGSVAFPSSTWNIIRNGNKILRGKIVIKGHDEDFLNVFFLSGNSNWFNILQFSLKEIDFADRFNVLIDSANTQKSNTEGIIFPLVDWWAKGQHRSNVFTQGVNQTQEEGPVFSEWHPCIYMSTVLTELCNYGGVKVAGDLITDPLFKKIIITPTGPDLFVPDWIVNESKITIYHPSGVTYATASDPQVMQWNDVRELPPLNTWNNTDYSFSAPRSATYQFDFKLKFSPNTAPYRIDLYLNGALDSTLYNGADNNNLTFYKSLSKGQKVQFYVTRTIGGPTYRLTGESKVVIKIVKSIGTWLPSTYYTTTGKIPYVLPGAIVPDIKAVDFIKFLCIYFGAVCSYEEQSKTLTINKYSRMKKENGSDWSRYYLSSKTTFNNQVASHNYIQMTEGEEDQMKAYNDQSKVTYGGGDIQSANDVTFERDIYKAPFSISWDQVNLSNQGLFLPFVKFYELQFEEEVAYSGVTSYGDVAGNTSAQFTATFNQNFDANSVFFIKSNSGEYTGWTVCRSSGSGISNPVSGMDYGSNDSGYIVKYSVSKVQSNSRLLIVKPGSNVSDAGGGTIYYYMANSASYASATTAALAWSDKPQISNQVIDTIFDSLAIDPVLNRTFNNTIGERYHREIERFYSNPKIDAMMLLPSSVFSSFNFQNYIYLNTKDFKGYFWVQKIDGYKDAETPVKVELLYAD